MMLQREVSGTWGGSPKHTDLFDWKTSSEPKMMPEELPEVDSYGI